MERVSWRYLLVGRAGVCLASLQWSGPGGKSAGDQGVLCHLWCSAKSWGAPWFDVLVFLQHGTELRQSTRQMARALAAGRLGWTQCAVMEQRLPQTWLGKQQPGRGACSDRFNEGVKWQMTDDGHVAQGAGYFGLKSCSETFGEINIFLFLMTVIHSIVLPLFV